MVERCEIKDTLALTVDKENEEKHGSDLGAEAFPLRAPYWNIISEMSISHREGDVKKETGDAHTKGRDLEITSTEITG